MIIRNSHIYLNKNAGDLSQFSKYNFENKILKVYIFTLLLFLDTLKKIR